jgi:hypothetical protein
MKKPVSLFVVLQHPAKNAEDKSAISFLSRDAFEGADERNTFWLEDWGIETNERLDVAFIRHLTIIIPPGEMKKTTIDKWAALVEAFFPKKKSPEERKEKKPLEKLTYVWVMENGEKFKPSPLITGNPKYEGVTQLVGMRFRSVRIEALPTDQCIPNGSAAVPTSNGVLNESSIFGVLELSEDTETVELHDIEAPILRFHTPAQNPLLSRILVTGTTNTTQIRFYGVENLVSLRTHFRLNKVTIIKGEMDQPATAVDLNESETGEDTGAVVLVFPECSPVNEKPKAGGYAVKSHHHRGGHTTSHHHRGGHTTSHHHRHRHGDGRNNDHGCGCM